MSAIEMYCVTDVGSIRENNEDCVAIFPKLKLVVIADGMGGHNAGEVASRRAIEVIRDAVRDGVGLKSAVIRANYEVYQLASGNKKYAGMGTTVVAAKYDGSKVEIACVGDSRLYRYRRNGFQQITEDQTLAQEMRNNKQEFRNGRHVSECEHVLTNALGIMPDCKPVMQIDVTIPGDMYLLCSDGLTGTLDDAYIEASFKQKTGSKEGLIQSLIDAANVRNAPDNISIALVRITPREERTENGKKAKKLGIIDEWNL